MKKKCKQLLKELREELNFYFGQGEDGHKDKVIVRSNLIYIGLSLLLLLGVAGLYWNSAISPGLNPSADAYQYAAVTEINNNTIAHGDIVDRNGFPIVTNKGAGEKSIYADDTAYSQVIGFTGPTKLVKGNQVSEVQNDYRLMKYLRDTLYQTVNVDGIKGCTIELTLDHELQMAVRDALLTQMGLTEKGSAVVLNAKTGEILSMVSFPTFQANDLKKGIQQLNHSEAVMEMHYPITHKDGDPVGSVFKLAVLIAQIDQGLEDYTVLDHSYQIDDAVITNIYGNLNKEIGYEEALIHSSNVYFSKVALEMGAEALDELAKKLHLGEYLELDFGSVVSNYNYEEKTDVELAHTAFGQGKLEMSTISAAMLTASIANDGVLIEPTLVRGIKDAEGNEVPDESEQVVTEITSKETADKVEAAMRKVAESYGYPNMAAKSGTAQNGDARDTNNAWYASFKGDYVVVVNQCKTYKGGTDLAPIVQTIYDYLEQNPVY